MKPERINVDGVGRLPVFSHAVIAGDHIYVSGMIGVQDNELHLVPGGIRAETTQTLRNIEQILRGCHATFSDVVKVNVYLTDMAKFPEMNEAYLEVLGQDPPARITVGVAALVLGALVEIDCVAFRPQ
ncbi:MAG: RidA family protein [Geodermatophilaceae bacterium]|nr:RidA family protein [Geodermatophilaceae bacterium]